MKTTSTSMGMIRMITSSRIKWRIIYKKIVKMMNKLFHNIIRIRMMSHMDFLRTVMMRTELCKEISKAKMSKKNINLLRLIKNYTIKIIVSIF
jgi:hypothetical protein